jgi:hypothetical protein
MKWHHRVSRRVAEWESAKYIPAINSRTTRWLMSVRQWKEVVESAHSEHNSNSSSNSSSSIRHMKDKQVAVLSREHRSSILFDGIDVVLE